MANHYKLTPRSDKNFTIRLKTLDTRFRVRSCKYPRIVKFDIFNKLQSKRRTTLNLEPARFLQRFIYQRYDKRILSLEPYIQNKLVRRPFIYFEDTRPIRKAEKAGYFILNDDEDFDFSHTPFILFTQFSKNVTNFICHNHLLYSSDESLNSKFFTNYSKIKEKADPQSVWCKRLAYKAEYRKRDLQFCIQNIMKLGYFKFVYLIGSLRGKSSLYQSSFKFPQRVFKTTKLFRKRKYHIRSRYFRYRNARTKSYMLYKTRFRIFNFIKLLKLGLLYYRKKDKQLKKLFDFYRNNFRFLDTWKNKKNKNDKLNKLLLIKLNKLKTIKKKKNKLSKATRSFYLGSTFIKNEFENDMVDYFLKGTPINKLSYSDVKNPFLSFMNGLNSLKQLYFIFYYNLNKQNLNKVQNVKAIFKKLKTKISIKLQKQKTINTWGTGKLRCFKIANQTFRKR